ncbi:Uncharacterised protein [Halioglobus japonicus]|nr:Uncharacterised protein [Halioglobus japonicus]
MCLLVFAHQVSPEFPLLIAANRDEFHGRATAASAFWEQYPDVLAGQDLEQGGTWMGVTRSGRFAAVTNYRDPARTAAAPRSRGALPLDFLTGTQEPRAYLDELAGRALEYAGFNLLVGDGNSLWYFTNSDDLEPLRLPPGIYGLSNARLDTPWPKVALGKARMQSLIETGAITHDALAAVVNDRKRAGRRELKELQLDGAMDPVLSAQFIVTETYGTRSTTTLSIHADGNTAWREQCFDNQGELRTEQRLAFQQRAI